MFKDVINLCGSLGKFSRPQNSSHFSKKTVYDISCRLSPSIGDDLHEMSKPLFRDKLEKYFNKSSANKNLRNVLSIKFIKVFTNTNIFTIV